jgi:hypothetical protein
LTGGRPMIREGEAFWDYIGLEKVWHWRDRLDGRRWMATTRWALFRIPAGGPR